MEAPVRVLALRPRIETLESGERVQVSTQAGREEFRVMFSRELQRGTSVTSRRPTGEFPGWAQGSWMITRRRDTGAGTQIRIFLRSDQNTHIQFSPLGADRSQLDVVLYGGYIARGIPIAVPFERLYVLPINDVIRLVEDKFPMRYFEPVAANYTDTRRFIENVRPLLRGLRFADDGALDENNNYVLIETGQRQNARTAGLNCSGFLKWLIDGMIRPVTGERLTIPPLKAPFHPRGSTFTENFEEPRDIFFGLDWNRNLASIANIALRTPAHGTLNEFEVRSERFSSILVNQNRTFVINSYPGFLNEAGYGVEGLHPLLYTLAIDEPFNFYLAALNREFHNPANPRGTPRLRQYFHVSALIPYFDENGEFRIVVFESAAETTFTGFLNRQRNNYVNLVRVPVVPRFDP